MTEQLKNVRSYREMGATMLEQEAGAVNQMKHTLHQEKYELLHTLPANNKSILRNVYSAILS